MRVVSFDIGLRNLAWCDLEVNTGSPDPTFLVHRWLVESAVDDSINVNATSLEFFIEPFTKLCLTIVDRLPLDEIDAVLIESQPMGHGRSFGGTSMGGSPRNLKTKVLSHILQSLLIQRGYSTANIHFISPMLKLRECPIPYRERNYKDNKKWAIEKTLQLIGLAHDELFVGSKRDDLADCFLQGYQVAKLVLNGSMKLEPAQPILKGAAKRKRDDSEAPKSKKAKTVKADSKTDKSAKADSKTDKSAKADSKAAKTAEAETKDEKPEKTKSKKSETKKPKAKKVSAKAKAETMSAEHILSLDDS